MAGLRAWHGPSTSPWQGPIINSIYANYSKHVQIRPAGASHHGEKGSQALEIPSHHRSTWVTGPQTTALGYAKSEPKPILPAAASQKELP